ncbi:MAG: ABC transporter permease [Candidatus Heimdallarchaeota archaeon]
MTFLVAKRVFKFLLRDKRLIALMLVVPIVMSLVIGYGFGGEVKHVEIQIVNFDNLTISPTSFSANFTDYLVNQTDLVDAELVNTTLITEPPLAYWNITKQAVLDGEFYGAIYIPEDFSDNLFKRFVLSMDTNTSVGIFIDNSNTQRSASIQRAINEAFEEAFGGNSGIEFATEYAFAEDLSQLDYMVPSIMPFAVFFMAFIISIISLINERKAGTLDLLLLSHYKKINIILGYMIPLSVVSLVQSVIVLLITIFVFNVAVIGGFGAYLAIFLMLLLNGWTGMGLGFLLSTIAKSELQAVQFIPMVIFTALLLSGILMPVETLPAWLRPLSYAIPLTYGAEYTRTVMIEGTGFLWHWHLLPVLGFVILMIFLSTLTLRENK